MLLTKVRSVIRALIAKMYRSQSLLGVGVSLPGTIDSSTGDVYAAENLCWYDIKAGRILSEEISAPIYFENNARLAALAERWFCGPGAPPMEHFVFVTMRNGLGTGVVIDGKLLQGASGQASEFGHTTLFPDGRPCVCGNTGCWEEYASDRALERYYAERLPQPESIVPADEIVLRAQPRLRSRSRKNPSRPARREARTLRCAAPCWGCSSRVRTARVRSSPFAFTHSIRPRARCQSCSRFAQYAGPIQTRSTFAGGGSTGSQRIPAVCDETGPTAASEAVRRNLLR